MFIFMYICVYIYVYLFAIMWQSRTNLLHINFLFLPHLSQNWKLQGFSKCHSIVGKSKFENWKCHSSSLEILNQMLTSWTQHPIWHLKNKFRIFIVLPNTLTLQILKILKVGQNQMNLSCFFHFFLTLSNFFEYSNSNQSINHILQQKEKEKYI